MPHCLTAAVLYLGLIPSVFADAIQKDDPKRLWLTDYATALRQSKQSNKLLFVVYR